EGLLVQEPADDHPGDDAEGGLDQPVAELPDVLHERHPAFGVTRLVGTRKPAAAPARGRGCVRRRTHLSAAVRWTGWCAANPAAARCPGAAGRPSAAASGRPAASAVRPSAAVRSAAPWRSAAAARPAAA